MMRGKNLVDKTLRVLCGVSTNPRSFRGQVVKLLATKGPVTRCNFLATCNAILLLRDVKLANTCFHHVQFAKIFLTYQTFDTNLYVLRVELRCKLQEKLHRVTGPKITS